MTSPTRPKGTLTKTKDGLWQIRIWTADGKRVRSKPLPAGTSEAYAREQAAFWAEKHKGKTAAELGRKSQTPPAVNAADAWVDVWHQDRLRRGLTSAKNSLGHWKNHIAAILGRKPPTAWTKDDFRALSAALDTKTQAGEISHKSAQNIWGTATKMADDACNAKLPTIRVRDDNPADGVRGPDSGPAKSKAYLYPSEFLAVMALPEDKAPLHWRRRIACAVYLGLRAGEQDVLQWGDLDLVRGIVNVRRAADRSRKNTEKATKTGGTRRFKIESELLPALIAMKAEADPAPTDRVFETIESTQYAGKLRELLRRAGVDRAELFASDATAKPLTWHDLRATSATWLAIRGDEPMRILERMGHRDLKTTMIYVRTAQQLGTEGFGEVFPSLPKGLARKPLDLSELTIENLATPRGFEPAETSVLPANIEVRGPESDEQLTLSARTPVDRNETQTTDGLKSEPVGLPAPALSGPPDPIVTALRKRLAAAILANDRAEVARVGAAIKALTGDVP